MTNEAIDHLQNDPQPNSKERLKHLASHAEGLAAVEQLIKTKLCSDAPLLEQIPDYLLSLGGKRLRPLLALLSARMCGMPAPSQALIDVAAGIELIHMATLLHDDIIDQSTLRRHQESPYSRYGIPATLLSGDFLLVRAFSLCARLDRFIIDETECACVELTEGEILETPLNREEHSLESSLRVARKKTASLFRLAAVSGAHIATKNSASDHAAANSKKVISEMGVFGEELGVAFQVLDDVLDVISSEDLLGKQSGLDLQERKPSIVNVLWLASGSTLAQRLTDSAQKTDSAFVSEALSELRESEVVREAKQIARKHAEQANDALERAAAACTDFHRETFEDLLTFVEFTIERMA